MVITEAPLLPQMVVTVDMVGGECDAEDFNFGDLRIFGENFEIIVPVLLEDEGVKVFVELLSLLIFAEPE